MSETVNLTELDTIDVTKNKISIGVATLRILLGGMILFAGLGKVSDWPFDAAGYLANIDPASPVSGIYGAMASSAALMEIVNVLVPATQLLIGIAFITGGLVRIAAVGGATQMLLFYLGGWSGDILALFDSTLIYAALFVFLGLVGAGRVYGADSYIESHDLVEQYPWLHKILG